MSKLNEKLGNTEQGGTFSMQLKGGNNTINELLCTQRIDNVIFKLFHEFLLGQGKVTFFGQ
jgi:hypothetical protein